MDDATDPAYAAARAFLWREARVLERRSFAASFEGAPPGGVLAALLAYRNDDGGFGHGMEPDSRPPDSLPIDVEVALQAMADAGVHDAAVVGGACDFLDTVATPEGAVPLALPVIERYPRAAHMAEWTYEPGLNPTAGLVGLCRAAGVAHPWLDRAEAWCWDALDGPWPTDAHALLEVSVLLEHVPDRARAEPRMAELVAALPSAPMFQLDPEAPGYGVTPLQVAPTPASPYCALLGDDLLRAHLDRLAGDQQDDGGWPLTWEPPGTAATLEWRGMRTLAALRTLVAHGRVAPPSAGDGGRALRGGPPAR